MIEDEKVYLTEKKVCLTCFQTEYLKTKKHTELKKFGLRNGHCFDGENNMWLFLQHFILLPFSYMTFVMRESNEYADDNIIFDPERYNFLMDKKTCLTIEENLCLDSETLFYILQNFERVDPSLLDLL